MIRLVVIFVIFSVISGCKVEEVGFSATEDVQRSSPSTPDPNDQSDDDDEPVPLVAPKVSIIQRPLNHQVSDSTFATFEIKEGDGEVVGLSCQVNLTEVPCDLAEQKVTLTGFPVGEYELKIVVTDTNKLSGQDTATWAVSEDPPPPTPPMVQIVRAAQNHLFGQETDVEYRVLRGSNPVNQVVCQIDGNPLACSVTGQVVKLEGFQVGDHVFTVSATDSIGLNDSAASPWRVGPALPPIVEIVREAQDHFLGESTRVVYRVVPGSNPIDQVLCQVDGNPLVCSPNGGSILLEGYGLGDHIFSVTATDSIGSQDSDQTRWRVAQKFIDKVTDVEVKFIEQKADILFVIDNSKSMQDEQTEVANKIGSFFNKIKDINWRVGIITTDPYEREPSNQVEDPFADGVLLPFPNGSYHLDSSLNLAVARDQFARTIFRPEQGNGHERGIRNTYRSIERYLGSSNNVKNRRLQNFYRSDASLTTVVISDENETVVDGINRPFTDVFRSEPRNLIDLVREAWGTEKKFQWNSVVIRENDFACIDPDPTKEEKFGVTYEQLSRLTDGLIEDKCADDYSSVLNKIGSGVVDLEKVYKLDCVPQDTNGDGVADVTVNSLDGNAVPGFAINGNQIEFDQPLAEGRYQIVYKCL